MQMIRSNMNAFIYLFHYHKAISKWTQFILKLYFFTSGKSDNLHCTAKSAYLTDWGASLNYVGKILPIFDPPP